jgi:hypothetical protein
MVQELQLLPRAQRGTRFGKEIHIQLLIMLMEVVFLQHLSLLIQEKRLQLHLQQRVVKHYQEQFPLMGMEVLPLKLLKVHLLQNHIQVMVGIPLHQEVPIELQMEEVILRLNQKHCMLSGVHLQPHIVV